MSTSSKASSQAGILKPPPSHVCTEDMESQQWTDGLNPSGLYYEGYMDDLQQMLTKHSSATVSTYGVRQSHTNHAVKSIDKENLDTSTSQNSKVYHKLISSSLDSFLYTDPKAILDKIRRW